MTRVHKRPVESAFLGVGDARVETPFIVKLRESRARKGSRRIHDGVDTA